jgi:hypothetical protein
MAVVFRLSKSAHTVQGDGFSNTLDTGTSRVNISSDFYDHEMAEWDVSRKKTKLFLQTASLMGS